MRRFICLIGRLISHQPVSHFVPPQVPVRLRNVSVGGFQLGYGARRTKLANFISNSAIFPPTRRAGGLEGVHNSGPEHEKWQT